LSDIFREVEEDVRREKLEKLWKAYGTHLIVLLVLALIGIAGFEVWQRYEANLRDKDSAAFAAAQRIADPKAAANAFATLGKTAHGGYGTLARMAQADALSTAGQGAQAAALYKDIANADHGNLGAVARLRAGWLTVDTAPHADLQTLLQPLLDPGSVWRQMAEEILAYSDYRAGKLLAADAEFAKIAADAAAPDALRTRAHTFDAFLSGGGATNYGSVPPPAPPSAINPAAINADAINPGDPSAAGGATP
jgi:hypothetical protein